MNSKSVFYTIALVLFLALAYAILAPGGWLGRHRVKAVVEEFNERLPIKVNEVMEINKVNYRGKTVTVEYTMIGKQKEFTEQQKQAIEQLLIKTACTDKARVILEQKVSIDMIFNYESEWGKQKLNISVTPNQCGI